MTELTSASTTTYGVVAPNRYHGAILKLLAGILLVGALLASQPVLAQARVVDCRGAVTPNITISSARNMSCLQAMRDMRRYHGSIDRSFPTPGGFRCNRVSGGQFGGQWRCTSGQRAYRFNFGD
jgi:hypothetical protein